MPFVGFVVFGMLIGAVGRMLSAGKAGSWTGSMLSGALGALVSGSVGRLEGLRDNHDSGGFSMALVGAFAVVAIYAVTAYGRRARAVALQPTKTRR